MTSAARRLPLLLAGMPPASRVEGLVRAVRSPTSGPTAPGRAPRTLLLAVIVGLALGGCMAPSFYRPATDGEGYRDEKLADNRYRVGFAGNEATPRETVEAYMRYRAAEVTLESGNDYFVIVRQDTERDVVVRTEYEAYGGYPPYYPFPPRPIFSRWWGFGVGPFYDPYDPLRVPVRRVERQTVRYRAFATIEVFKGPPGPDVREPHDAREVIRRLAGAVSRPPP